MFYSISCTCDLNFRSVAFDIRSVLCFIQSVVFDIRSVLCFIQSVVYVTLIFNQLRLIFDQLYMLLFRSVAFDIRSVVSFFQSVVYVTFSISCV